MPEPLDSSDLDALEDLKRSRGYELLRERIDSELEARRRAIETDLQPEQTWAMRGYIRALRVVLSLPEILQHEISKAIEET